MKLTRTYLFIAISTLALVLVLIIQINWLLDTAKVKEHLFNEKAIMVLSKTADAISSDKEIVKNSEIKAGSKEVRKIDSLFNYYMRFYNIQIAYFFEVKPGKKSDKGKSAISEGPFQVQLGCYTQCIKDDTAGDGGGLELKLVFPEKEQFIIEEMSLLFITSVILILVVIVLFWQTILALMKEKRIVEHTRDFLNNMTHEFKTPLTNIALAGKMIVKDSTIKNEEKIKHYSGIIRDENEKLRLQVEQVLSMTALERGEIPLQLSELNFHALISEALKCISIQVEHKEGSLKLDLKAEHFVIMGDKTHLTNALCNLIDNALKYSKEKPEILIQSSNADNNLMIVISDNGIGIGKEYQKMVFDKYFRVPTGDVHDVKGFGLGLAYVKKIIELHEGTIELESEIGRGTRFTIRLTYV